MSHSVSGWSFVPAVRGIGPPCTVTCEAALSLRRYPKLIPMQPSPSSVSAGWRSKRHADVPVYIGEIFRSNTGRVRRLLKGEEEVSMKAALTLAVVMSLAASLPAHAQWLNHRT